MGSKVINFDKLFLHISGYLYLLVYCSLSREVLRFYNVNSIHIGVFIGVYWCFISFIGFIGFMGVLLVFVGVLAHFSFIMH